MRENLIVHQDPKSPISEIFRTLRTNIQFMSMKKQLKSLLISSTLPGEGKSWVSSNLAVAFAQAGKKVILVDADMRKGTQYSIFGVSPIPGLSNYLSGIGPTSRNASSDLSDYIQETEIDNLYVMSAGNVPPNPSELLVSQAMIDLLESLKQICDLVIIDGTPNGLVTDSLILTGIVDSTIIVTASGYTKKDALKKIVNNIKNIGGNIAGVVLNKVPTNAKKYEESYYYGSTAMNNIPKSRNANRWEGETKKTTTRNSNYANNVNTKKNPNMQEKSVANQKTANKVENTGRKTKQYTGKSEVISKRINENRENDRLKNNLNFNKVDEISIDKTADILKQVNEYLDKQKESLK